MKKKSGRKAEQAENKKIAVIEEIADDIYSIKFILQSIGYNVESFSSQDSYQDALVEFAPQLVIIDMMISELHDRLVSGVGYGRYWSQTGCGLPSASGSMRCNYLRHIPSSGRSVPLGGPGSSTCPPDIGPQSGQTKSET